LPALEVRDLTAGFLQKPLINNLSFKLDRPSFIAIIGHNGCGKTTFFRSLLNKHPFKGEIYFDGQEIRTIPELSFTGLAAMLEQKNNVNFSLPVKDLMVMGRFRRKRFFENYDEADYTEVERILKTLDLSYVSSKDYLEISGGEQQLVWLGQVMLQDTKFILLDEPTQQLDVYNKKIIFKLMQQWVKEENKTVLCITHDLSNLLDMEGYILNLSAKELKLEKISEGTVKENIKWLEEKINKKRKF
jgi:iron complex transport system ATP-binding protein